MLSHDEKKTLYTLLREDKGNVLDQFLMGKNHFNYSNKQALTVSMLSLSLVFYQPGLETKPPQNSLFLECRCAKCFDDLSSKTKVLNDFSRLKQMAKKKTCTPPPHVLPQ